MENIPDVLLNIQYLSNQYNTKALCEKIALLRKLNDYEKR